MASPSRRSKRPSSRTIVPRNRAQRRRPRYTAPSVDVAPEVLRSIVGIVLMVLGAIVLIGMLLPGQGALTDWIRNVIAPWFGTGRWILPFLLLGAGIYVERAGPRAGWGATLLGLTIAFIGMLGTIAVLVDAGYLAGRSGGRIGGFLSGSLGGLITSPGALILCMALIVVGVLIALNATLGSLLRPTWDAARATGGVLLAPRGSVGGPGGSAAEAPGHLVGGAPGAG